MNLVEVFPPSQLFSEEFPVQASKLHMVLEVCTPFRKWIERRLAAGGFEENFDFQSRTILSTSGQTKKDYALSLDAAKEMGMMESTPPGKLVRKYFIRCEKAVREELPRLKAENEHLKSELLAEKTKPKKVRTKRGLQYKKDIVVPDLFGGFTSVGTKIVPASECTPAEAAMAKTDHIRAIKKGLEKKEDECLVVIKGTVKAAVYAKDVLKIPQLEAPNKPQPK